MKRYLSHIYTALCGDFNGIQVFWSPGTLLYILSSTGVLAALSSALSFRMHYMPLFIFLIVLAYVVFVAAKLKLFYANLPGAWLDEFIGLNISVLGLFLISLIIYAVSAFMLYFYGIDGTLKPVLLLLFKSYTAIIILYHYLLSLWMNPFYGRNYGRIRARKAFLAWLRKHVYIAVRYTILVMIMVLAAIKLYQIVISLVLMPFIEGLASSTGLNLQLNLQAFYSMNDIVINLGILILALLISNTVFYPLVYSVNKLAQWLLPIKSLRSVSHAKAA